MMIHDLLIIGGGINGAALAREAAINGLSVLLVERGDLGGETSSASTKLIHGGLRYLEQREFRLVRAALQERERLLAAAPHMIYPMRFVLPHVRGIRPWRSEEHPSELQSLMRISYAVFCLIKQKSTAISNLPN